MLKTAQRTAKDTGISLKTLLLELQSTPIASNMSLPWEIMHNHTVTRQALDASQHEDGLGLPDSEEANTKEAFGQVPWHDTCQALTLARKYYSFPWTISGHISLAPP